MMTLYDFTGSGNGYKVGLVLAHLGLPYKRIERDILKGETRTPEFLAKNPNGRIPTLQLEDGSHLFESNAIIWYLAEGTRLAPKDRRARAETLQWMFFEQYSHEPFIATVRFWKHFLPRLTPLQEMELPGRMEKGYAALGVMEQRLAHHPISSPTSTASPTSRSMPTPTSRARVGSISTTTRTSTPGWRASPASPATSRSTTRTDKGEKAMPMINVQMFEGRTPEQRRKLAKELTEGTCRALGCTPDAVQIILTDIKKENWAEAGKLFSD